MPLSAEHQSLVQQWLRLHAPRLACQGCGGPLGPGGELVQLNQVEGDGSVSIGDGPLLVQLGCRVCGCTVFFAAAPMGIGFDEAGGDEDDPDEGVEALFHQ